MSVFWIPLIAIIGGIFMVVSIVSAGAKTRQRSAQLKADVQMKLIDRFGSAAEFINFVQSPEGKQFLGDAPRAARANFIGSIRIGIITAFIGLGFTIIGIVDHDSGWFIPAFILLGIGIGFFVSAIISMKLARQMDVS